MILWKWPSLWLYPLNGFNFSSSQFERFSDFPFESRDSKSRCSTAGLAKTRVLQALNQKRAQRFLCRILSSNLPSRTLKELCIVGILHCIFHFWRGLHSGDRGEMLVNKRALNLWESLREAKQSSGSSKSESRRICLYSCQQWRSLIFNFKQQWRAGENAWNRLRRMKDARVALTELLWLLWSNGSNGSNANDLINLFSTKLSLFMNHKLWFTL